MYNVSHDVLFIPRMPDFVCRKDDPFWEAPVVRRVAHPSAKRIGPLEEQGGLHDKRALERKSHNFIDPKRNAQVESLLKIAQWNLKQSLQREREREPCEYD